MQQRRLGFPRTSLFPVNQKEAPPPHGTMVNSVAMVLRHLAFRLQLVIYAITASINQHLSNHKSQDLDVQPDSIPRIIFRCGNREHMSMESPSPSSHSELYRIIAVSSRSQRVFTTRILISSEDSRDAYGQVPIFNEQGVGATEFHVGYLCHVAM